MNLDAFIARIAKENLSISKSIVAYDKKKPVSILLNGIQEVNGFKIAWNGGTSVVPEYRKKGVGKFLVETSEEINRGEGVEIATLEAISENTPAIELYKIMGYEIVDSLLWMNNDLDLKFEESDHHYSNDKGSVHDILSLDIYNRDIKPWLATSLFVCACRGLARKQGFIRLIGNANTTLKLFFSWLSLMLRKS